MITSNSVSADNDMVRAERLQLLSTNIDTHAVEIGIVIPRLTACQTADADWDNACAKCVVEDGQKDEAFETFHQAVLAASKYYQMAKDHLLTIIYEVEGAPDDYINSYGLDVHSPRKYKKLTAAIEAWKRNHDLLVGLLDPRVLTDAIMTNLWAHKTGMDGLSNAAFIEKEEARTSFDEKQALYDVQPRLLQFVLTAAILTWGNEDPRLNLLGFLPASEVWTEGGGGTSGDVPDAPVDFGYLWLDPVLQFGWHAVDGATSYQLAFSEDGGEVWEELYVGADMNYEYEPPVGLRQYRVRARNASGYGEWSEIVEFEVAGAPPMGEWPNELTGFYANYSDFPSPIFIVGHDGQTGADSYSLKRVKVLITDPDPTDADMPVDYFMQELTADPVADNDIAPGDKCAYWVCGVQGGVEGEWAGPVIGEYEE